MTLTPQQVISIRLAANDGASKHDLAAQYNTSTGMINHIIYGRSYRNTGGPIQPPPGKDYYPQHIIRHARQLAVAGISVERIAKELNVKPRTVRNWIKRCKDDSDVTACAKANCIHWHEDKCGLSFPVVDWQPSDCAAFIPS